MSRSMRVVSAVLLMLLVAMTVGYVGWRSAQAETRYPVETRDVVVPHETTTVVDPERPSSERLIVVQGRDGVVRTFTYFEERWVGGRLRERKRAEPKGRPLSSWVTTPTSEIVQVGALPGSFYELNAAAEKGLAVGRIDASGLFAFKISGSITFAGARTVSGPSGNATYDHFRIPIRGDVPPGAALFRIGKGRWLALTEIDHERKVYKLRGKPGQVVTAVVNDSPRYYADNRGSFAISVLKGIR